MHSKKIVIAIDGFSSCGKSTLAKALARTLGYAFIDSGAMYRAITLYALQNKLILNGEPLVDQIIASLPKIKISFVSNPESGQNTTFMNGRNIEMEIRRLYVSENVSPVSAIREVRMAMVEIQQEMGIEKGIVMDGRDIGTVVFPNAELKIFMTADPEIRAARRFMELKSKGLEITLDEIKQNIAQRDYIDQNRDESPLRKANDAIVLDNSYLTPEQQLEWAIQKVNDIIDRNEN